MPVMNKLKRTRDERGAVAVLAGVLAVCLFTLSAFAIDLGQAWAKKSLLQTNVDIAVMAAAAELDNDGACNVEVIDVATEYLTKPENAVPEELAFKAVNLGGSPGDPDGFIRCNDWKVELWAPEAHVAYGPARLIAGAGDSLEVPAFAAAQIKSPSQSHSLPMYAVSGCDYGQQTIADPPPGPPLSKSPPAMTPIGTAEVKGLVITPSEAPDDAVEPFPVTVTGQVKGVPAGTTGQVTFTNPTTGDIIEAGTASGLPTGPGWNSFSISVGTVPQTVLDVTGIWWVRIKVVNGASTNYSPNAEAIPFTNGELMFCDGAVSGNFGTLKIARSDGTPATWIEMNIIKGLEPVMQVNGSSVVPCSPVDSDSTPSSPTDCVSTDPGFANEAATDGLVNGSGGHPGRLDHDTTPGCDRNGGSSRTQSAPKQLNDDMLSCFITGGHSVADVVAGVPEILSSDIFKSPRFFMIPVIPVEAASGASGAYPIIDFRPGFITEEASSATAGNPGSITGHNGVWFHSSHVEKLNVVLFDEAALPESAPAVGGEVDYIGHGTKVLVMVE